MTDQTNQDSLASETIGKLAKALESVTEIIAESNPEPSLAMKMIQTSCDAVLSNGDWTLQVDPDIVTRKDGKTSVACTVEIENGSQVVHVHRPTAAQMALAQTAQIWQHSVRTSLACHTAIGTLQLDKLIESGKGSLIEALDSENYSEHDIMMLRADVALFEAAQAFFNTWTQAKTKFKAKLEKLGDKTS